jgi:hypothetical protein
MLEYRFIVAGGRDFNNYEELVHNVVGRISMQTAPASVEIVTGGATGADQLAKELANLWGFQHKEFLADWGKYGKAAGPIRNEEMAKYIQGAGHLIAFWNGQSRGTADMIKKAREYKINTTIIYYD